MSQTVKVILRSDGPIPNSRWCDPVDWKPANVLDGLDYEDGAWWNGDKEVARLLWAVDQEVFLSCPYASMRVDASFGNLWVARIEHAEGDQIWPVKMSQLNVVAAGRENTEITLRIHGYIDRMAQSWKSYEDAKPGLCKQKGEEIKAVIFTYVLYAAQFVNIELESMALNLVKVGLYDWLTKQACRSGTYQIQSIKTVKELFDLYCAETKRQPYASLAV